MRRRQGLSLTDLLIVIAVIGILIALLLPAISAARSSARRVACTNNQRQLSLAVNAYAEARNTYPASAFYGNGKFVEGKISAVVPGATKGGAARSPYSVFVTLLPYIELANLYEIFDLKQEAFDEENRDTAAMTLRLLICPNYTGPHQSNAPDYPGDRKPAIGNYKTLGATTWSVLNDPDGVKAKDGDGGAIHPYEPVRALQATSQTILFCETRETVYSAWYDGTTASIPGFQPSVDKGKKCTTPALNFRRANHTEFLGKNDFGGSKSMAWGPSSEHPGIVNHAFADTSARAISDGIDAAVYKPLITRRADDNRRDAALFE